MIILITLKKDTATFTPEFTANGEEAIFKLLNPKRTDMAFSVKKTDTLPLLNYYLERIKEFNSNDWASVCCKNLLTFIDEAVIHREYCTPEMLKSFENCLGYCLFSPECVWIERKDDDATIEKASLPELVSKKDIKEIYKNVMNPIEQYSCNVLVKGVELLPVMLIQVTYTLLMCLFKRKCIIKRCENCGTIFVPERSNEKYCKRITDGKTCSQIKKLEHQALSHEKELYKYYKRVWNKLYQQGEGNEDALAEEYKKLKSEQERREYLDYMNSKYSKRKPKSTI